MSCFVYQYEINFWNQYWIQGGVNCLFPVLMVDGCLNTIISVCWIRGKSSKHLSPALTQALSSDLREETGSALLQVIHPPFYSHQSAQATHRPKQQPLRPKHTPKLERGTYVSIRCGTFLQSQSLLSFVVVIFWLTAACQDSDCDNPWV